MRWESWEKVEIAIIGGNKRLLCPEIKSRECLKQEGSVSNTTETSEEIWACLSAQSCPTLWDPLDCSPQAPLSMGYWSGLPFYSSKRSSQPKDLTHISHVSHIGRQILYHWAPGKPWNRAWPIKFDDIKVFGDPGKNCFRGFVVGEKTRFWRASITKKGD